VRTLGLLLALLPGVAAGGPLTAQRSGAAREKLLRARGGSAATEEAVQKALRWLLAHQRDDGHWDADGFDAAEGCDCTGKGGGWHGERVPCPFDREVTALATLAFLGAGHTHRDGLYAEPVGRALAWLRRAPGGTLFATAYATQALAEAYDLTADEELRPAVEEGVRALLDARQSEACWRYFPAEVSDVPTTTAVVCALRVAEECSFRVDDAYKRPALKLLDALLDRETGRVAYHPGADRLGYTPTTANASSALLLRSWLGQSRATAEVAASLKAVAERRPRWSIRYRRMKVGGQEREVQIGNLDLYGWWHATEGLARLGGPDWTAWNAALKKALLGHQKTTGHATGSWDPEGTYGKVGGRVFATALGALMLESYYRYP
jgi:hypothetical protein